jgi:hypothetical protein
MNLDARIHRWHSPTVFTLVALCFLLPFATVFVVGGCGGTKLHSRTEFTGAQLVTHTVPRGGRDPSCKHDISVCVERAGATAADVAFGAAIVGLLLGLLGIARGPGWCALVGMCALLTAGWNLANLSVDVASLRAGYWLAVLLFFWAGVVHLRRAWRRVRPPGKRTNPPFLWGHPRLDQPPFKGDWYV